MKEILKALTTIIGTLSFIGLIGLCFADSDHHKEIQNLRSDSTATHAELEHLKRELRKCNSDSSHKNCLIIKEK